MVAPKEFDVEKIRENVRENVRKEAVDLGIMGAIFAGFLGGLILNIMPCVLPVIGLKILSFVEQAGHNRRRALMLNVWYSAGLLAVFFILASLAIGPQHLGWGELFGRPWFTITLSAVVFVMALSFMGVWEVPLPTFLGSGKTGELAAQEGAAGAFFKGVLTTFLATPCSAPIFAPALVWATAQPAWLTYTVFLSAGLGMASPYLLVGAFPALLRFLPKPGAWMETFKTFMGFVLMGTVVYLLAVLEPQYVSADRGAVVRSLVPVLVGRPDLAAGRLHGQASHVVPGGRGRLRDLDRDVPRLRPRQLPFSRPGRTDGETVCADCNGHCERAGVGSRRSQDRAGQLYGQLVPKLSPL